MALAEVVARAVDLGGRAVGAAHALPVGLGVEPLDRAARLTVGDGRADRVVAPAPLARPHQPAHLLVQLVERLEPEVAAAGEGHAREDLPVGEADAVAPADRPQPLTSAFPRGDVPVLLEEGARGQERVGVALERPELEALHDLHGHVVEGPAHEVAVGQVAQRVDADQEQHVDLAVGARPQDAHRVAARLAVHQRPPRPLDVVDLAASRGRRAAATDARRPAARRGRSPGASRTGTARPRHRPRPSRRRPHPVAPPRARRPSSPASSQGGERLVEGLVGPAGQQSCLVARHAQHVGRHVVQAGPARMQHPDASPATGGLAQAQVQDRHLLLGVEARQRRSRRLVPRPCRSPTSGSSRRVARRPPPRVRRLAGGRGRSCGTPCGRASTARSSPRPSAGRR